MNPDHHSMSTGGGQPPGSSEVCVGFVLLVVCAADWYYNQWVAVAVAEPASSFTAATTVEFNTYDVSDRPTGQHGRRKRRFV